MAPDGSGLDELTLRGCTVAMRTRGRGLTGTYFLALLPMVVSCAGVARAQGEIPPPLPGSTLQLRAVLNQDTKPLALLAVKDEETRVQLLQVLDVLLHQTNEVTFWRYGPSGDAVLDMDAGVTFYAAWAQARGFRAVGRYVSHRSDDSADAPRITGIAEMHLATGDGGGLLAVYSEADAVSLVWAEGKVSLGPLLAPLLGLPPLTSAAVEGVEPVEPDLPLLPQGLPMDLLIARLDLTSHELLPLAAEVAAMAEAGDAEVPADALVLMRMGPDVLADVQGLTAIAFRTPRSTQTERVVGAALGYADAREWTALYETTVGGVEAQLFAKLGDVGGILIVGKREGMTALLITKGAPNLLALLAGLS
ncbi:MAG: hypothetical protein QM328_00455 [Acidobacteriota bacterium]|nr:hypothetical protein [Acidobacteriota bacterium]